MSSGRSVHLFLRRNTHINSQVSLLLSGDQCHPLYELVLKTGAKPPFSALLANTHEHSRMQSDNTAKADTGTQIKEFRDLTHVPPSHAAGSVDPFIRTAQASSSLDSLFPVIPGLLYFHSFFSVSIVNIILVSFFIVETWANFPEPLRFFTES